MQQCKCVSQHERMHVHALCVNRKLCKEITTRKSLRVGEAEISSREDGKALYTTRGLCECVANCLTRAVLNTAMGGARLLQPLEFPGIR